MEFSFRQGKAVDNVRDRGAESPVQAGDLPVFSRFSIPPDIPLRRDFLPIISKMLDAVHHKTPMYTIVDLLRRTWPAAGAPRPHVHASCTQSSAKIGSATRVEYAWIAGEYVQLAT